MCVRARARVCVYICVCVHVFALGRVPAKTKRDRRGAPFVCVDERDRELLVRGDKLGAVGRSAGSVGSGWSLLVDRVTKRHVS